MQNAKVLVWLWKHDSSGSACFPLQQTTDFCPFPLQPLYPVLIGQCSAAFGVVFAGRNSFLTMSSLFHSLGSFSVRIAARAIKDASHFQEGLISEKLEVFVLDTIVFAFTWGLSIWFSGYCRSSAQHKRTVLSEGLPVCPNKHTQVFGGSNKMRFSSIQAKS